jgi:hypothetical protein
VDRLNQPPAFGGRSGVAPVITGAVWSYFNPYPNGLLWLPARSRHVPVTDAAALSGPP